MMYGGNGNVSVESGGNNDRGSGISGGDCYLESTDPVLNSLSNLYSEIDVFPL